MNKEDKDWLINVFPTFFNKTVKGDTVQAYYRAEMLLDGRETFNTRSCSCQYRSLKNTTESKYKKWVEQNT